MVVDYGERLRAALTYARRSVRELSDGIGVTYQAISRVLDGHSKALNAENTARAARFLRVSGYWLATGDGPMTSDVDAPALTPDEQAMLDLWRGTHADGRKALQAVGHALAQPIKRGKARKA